MEFTTSSPVDPPDKYVRSFQDLPAVTLEIKKLRDALEDLTVDLLVHPAARIYLQGAMDSLDLAAHKIHQACNL